MMVNGPSGQATSGSTSGKGSGALPDTRGGEGWVIDGEILCGLLEKGKAGQGVSLELDTVSPEPDRRASGQ